MRNRLGWHQAHVEVGPRHRHELCEAPGHGEARLGLRLSDTGALLR